jgi:hypothetical protein
VQPLKAYGDPSKIEGDPIHEHEDAKTAAETGSQLQTSREEVPGLPYLNYIHTPK